MKPEYAAFLDVLIEEQRQYYHASDRASVTRSQVVRAKCQSFTKRFVERFPHLTRIAGFYGAPEDVWLNDPDEQCYRTEHFWCVDVNGTIVDPTVEQFIRKDMAYTVLDPLKHKIQIGRCIECGEYIYGLRSEGNKCICSPECQKSAEIYYNSI